MNKYEVGDSQKAFDYAAEHKYTCAPTKSSSHGVYLFPKVLVCSCSNNTLYKRAGHETVTANFRSYAFAFCIV